MRYANRGIEQRETIYGQRFLLSGRGLRFVAAWFGVSLTHVAEIRRQASDPLMQRGVKYAVHTLYHTVGITRFRPRQDVSRDTPCSDGKVALVVRVDIMSREPGITSCQMHSCAIGQASKPFVPG